MAKDKWKEIQTYIDEKGLETYYKVMKYMLRFVNTIMLIGFILISLISVSAPASWEKKVVIIIISGTIFTLLICLSKSASRYNNLNTKYKILNKELKVNKK